MMNEQRLLGFAFSDRTGPYAAVLSVDAYEKSGKITIGARCEDAKRNMHYEAILDVAELQQFGQMCIAFARQMQS